MDNRTVEALRRFERWVFAVGGVLFLTSVAYCLWPRGVEAPIRGLGEPTNIVRRSEYTCVCYVVDQPIQDAFTDVDMRLQIKGFKRENRWGFSYRRGESEIVTVDRGVWRNAPDGTLWLDSEESGKTTIAYTVRTEGWWGPWRKAGYSWDAIKANGVQSSVSTYRRTTPKNYRGYPISPHPIRVIR
jgi:hypothetical protein